MLTLAALKTFSDLVDMEIAENAAFLKVEIARVERGFSRMLTLVSSQCFRIRGFLQLDRRSFQYYCAFQMVNYLE